MKFTTLIVFAGVTQAARLRTHNADGMGGPPMGDGSMGGPPMNTDGTYAPPMNADGNYAPPMNTDGSMGGPPMNTDGSPQGPPMNADGSMPPMDPNNMPPNPCPEDTAACWDAHFQQMDQGHNQEHDDLMKKAREHSQRGLELMEEILAMATDSTLATHGISVDDAVQYMKENVEDPHAQELAEEGIRNHADQKDEGVRDGWLSVEELEDAIEFLEAMEMENMEQKGMKFLENHAETALDTLLSIQLDETDFTQNKANKHAAEAWDYWFDTHAPADVDDQWAADHERVFEFGFNSMAGEDGIVSQEELDGAIEWIMEMMLLPEDEEEAVLEELCPEGKEGKQCRKEKAKAHMQEVCGDDKQCKKEMKKAAKQAKKAAKQAKKGAKKAKKGAKNATE